MLLQDKVALITGGAHGMGRAIALKFADEGCSVAVADILGDEVKDTAAEVAKKGREAIAIQFDQTDSRLVRDMVDKAISRFGRVDILVNTAGAGAPSKSITDYSEEEWDRIFALHAKGPFLCSKYVVPHMKAQKSGNIINFSSIAATYPPSARANYASAKSAVIGLTSSMAVELAAYNIRVNVIIPGIIRTEFYDREIPPGTDKDAFFEKLGKDVLLGRCGTAEDIAGVALFFASDLSAYVTGSQITVGGGAPFRRPPGPPAK